jgi:hypothetical protein
VTALVIRAPTSPAEAGSGAAKIIADAMRSMSLRHFLSPAKSSEDDSNRPSDCKCLCADRAKPAAQGMDNSGISREMSREYLILE